MFKKYLDYLLSAIRVQLFITLVSLPILVLWSLPVSSLSIVGNLIFTPILAVFLLISSIIFFLEIIYLPNRWAIYILEKLTLIWLRVSPSNPKQYLLFFPKNSWIVFIVALIMAIYVIVFISKKRQFWLLGLILISSCIIAKLSIWITINQTTIFKRKNRLEISYHDGKLILNDYGTLNHAKGFENWLNFTLMPTLIKNFGTLKVQSLQLNKTTKSTNQNLDLLKQYLLVEQTYQKQITLPS